MGKAEGKVVFVENAVPGDVADVLLTKNKKDWAQGRVLQFQSLSKDRVEPFCQHFGTCGGCKWQMLPYELQAKYKQQEAEQNLRRIGRLSDESTEFLPIAAAEKTKYYRNKLEFTASNKRYLTKEEIDDAESIAQSDAIGFHAPGIFDKVINIYTCYLMDEVNNRIRNFIRDFALLHKIEFYDIREHTGWLRNVIVRYTSLGELMVNICVHNENAELLKALCDGLLSYVPEISTLLYTINPKFNDTIYDLEPVVVTGSGYVTEQLGEFKFIISPKSFFQTNTQQAEKLYGIARDFAGLTGNEVLYDLYCGTGSIGIFMSKGARKIVGVELVEEAIEDAKKNAALNNIEHAAFFAGDVIKICNDEFFDHHGRPDVVVTDPPRAGMHEKLVQKLLEIQAPKIVYVSCNTATQARDIALLSEKYHVVKVQPVDMFPHTHHIESVALLKLKD